MEGRLEGTMYLDAGPDAAKRMGNFGPTHSKAHCETAAAYAAKNGIIQRDVMQQPTALLPTDRCRINFPRENPPL